MVGRSTQLLHSLLLLGSAILAPAEPPSRPAIISGQKWEWTRQAADLSNRIYLFRSFDSFHPSETYYESNDKRDAVVVAVDEDKCIIAFRGTKPVISNEIEGPFHLLPTVAAFGMDDIFQNMGTAIKRDIASKTDSSKTCSVGAGLYDAYYNVYNNTASSVAFEDQIDQQCVEQGLPLVFTGHSQGATLAQFAAVRYEAQQPDVVLFGPAPAFFDDCPTLPDERVVNFVNTEAANDEFPIEFDFVPFMDVLVTRFIDHPNLSLWKLLPRYVKGLVALGAHPEDPVDFFVGGYKGAFFILNPNSLLSTAYVEKRDDIMSRDDFGAGLDFLDFWEMLDFSTKSFGERFLSAHDPFEYTMKIDDLFEANKEALVAEGFEPLTDCVLDSDYMCAGICTGYGVCSNGNAGDTCSLDNDCLSGRCSVGFCQEGLNGDYCDDHSDCRSGRCDWELLNLLRGICKPRLRRNELCSKDEDCLSERCVLYHCASADEP